MDLKERVLEERLKGHCCSESVMSMALEDMGRAPEDCGELITAMGAYCGGMREGLACGALCGAKSALYVAAENPAQAHDELGPELMTWFKERFGAWNCAELLAGDDSRKLTLCPIIVEDTYRKLYETLEDIGAV